MTSSYPYIFRSLVFIIATMFSIVSLSAQRPTEKELELETLYIEATRARLLGDHEKAIASYKKILDEDDSKDVVYYELAKIYLQLELPKEALDVIKKAVDLQPRNIWYQEELAAAHAANDDYISSSAVYKSLIAQEPGEQKFYFDLAFFQVKNNNIKDAISTFDKHEQRFGVSEDVIGRKFNLYKTLGNESKAEHQLTTLVNAFPNESSYAFGLAKFYQDINNNGKAKSTYQKILKSDPQNIEAQVALNNLEGGQSQEISASIWNDPNVNIDIKISKIIPAINGLTKATAEKRAQIIEITQQITETHPTEAKAFAVHGDVLNFSDKPKEAIVAYEAALKLEKNIFSVWDQLLNLYMYQHDMQSLYDMSERALDYFPNESKVYYLNGFAANRLLKYSDALSSLQQAEIMSNSDVQMHAKIKVALASTYLGLGKIEKVKPLLKEGLAMAPNNVELMTQASETYLAIDDLMTVEELFMRGLKRQPSQWQIHYTSAKLAYKNGDYALAKNTLLKMKAPNGAFHVSELMGDILFQLGDVDGAVNEWKASKAAGNPDSNLSKKISSRQI